ncbi:MAG: Fic family protein [Chitinophagales bacterium]
MKPHRNYDHLLFKKHWEISQIGYVRIGQCVSLLKAISKTPILPDFYKNLKGVALIKGAQSTTAIEGNTLSDEDIIKLQKGNKLPKSMEYQGTEVTNILEAFNTIFQETAVEKKEQLITPDLLLRFHQMIGKNLGDNFQAIPGKFRTHDVIVGTYKCPDYRDVELLINKYCDFLKDTFKYEQGKQEFSDVFIQAIVAHVYLEWIHPFGDGNGRLGRLLEFYILSRGGYADITLHILSNHYNSTRTQYYRELEKASQTKDLSSFIEYALLGFRDGLQQTLEKIQESQVQITWQKYVYDKFDSVDIGQREVFKRKRRFALELPLGVKFSIDDVVNLKIELAQIYSNISEKTLERDLKELVELNILKKDENNMYCANLFDIKIMQAKHKGFLEDIL